MWLRSLLFKPLADMIVRVESSADMESEAKAIMMEFNALRSTLMVMAGKGVALQQLIDDFSHMMVLIRGMVESCAPLASSINKALSHLGSDIGMKPLRDAMSDSPLGRAVAVAASCLVQAHAKDEIGTEKAALARRLLADTRLPILAEGSGPDGQADAQVNNFGMPSDMSAIDALEESVGHMSEAVQLWSHLKAEESADTVRSWVSEITHTMHFYDEVLSMFLDGFVASLPIGAFLFSSGADDQRPNASAMALAEVDSFRDLDASLRTHPIGEQPFVDFVGRVRDFISSLADDSKFELNSSTCFATLDMIENNLKVRGAITDCLEQLSSVTSLPKSPDEMCDDWRTKKGHHERNASHIVKHIDLLSALDTLKGMTSESAGDDGGEPETMVIVLNEGKGLTQFVGSYERAKGLPTAFGKLRYPS